MALEVGQTIGDYQVIAILGAGGMGKVYKVRNIISDRIEAMKILLPNLAGDPELADRFVREIKVQASLHHPNIAGLHTAQRVDNQLLMIMEFVEGQSLEAALRHGPLPLEDAVDYLCQVLSALSYAHAHGVVHRDIKPANVMLTSAGLVKLMDFGIARVVADRKLTQTGRTVGSLYYMSPEQIQGAVNLDGRADLYSLGVSFYEMVTGKRPFEGDSDYTIMAAHFQETPVPPIEIDPRLPEALNEVILMSIAKSPDQRFQSADAFRNALMGVAKAQGMSLKSVTGPAQPPAAPADSPAAAAPPAQAAAAAGAAIRPGNARGLYIAIGAVATLVVLILAAIQIPSLLKTSADQVTMPTVEAPADPGAVPQAEPLQAQSPITAPPSSAPATAGSPPPDARPPVSQAATEIPARPAPARKSAPQAGRTSAPPAVQTDVGTAPSSAAAQQIPVQTAPPQQAAPTPSQAPAAPAQDAAKAAQVRELRDRIMMMAVRLNAARSSLKRLEDAQARQGLGLRADLKAADQRLDFLMDEAEAALKAGDPAAGKKNLDAAERQLETVEKILGI